jgi:dTDP-glucose 4,6-dehydratase
MTILEFAKRISQNFGRDLQIDFKPLPADDPKVRRPDVSKALRVLGWKPVISLEQGLTATIGYFKSSVTTAEYG